MATLGGLAAVMAVTSVTMLGVAGAAPADHPGAALRLTKPELQAQRYVQRAVLRADNGPDCQPAHHRATYPGPPPPGFRAVLGIFRGGPIRRASSALQKLIGINKVSLYVNYVRRAAVINGTTYYVYVSDSGDIPSANVHRCLAAERAAFAAELPSIPAALQQPAKQLLAIRLAADRRTYRERVREGVTLIGHPANGGGGGVAGATATEIRDQGFYGFTCCTQGKVLFGLVPDGVATVTFVYPRQRATGPHRRWLPVATRTAKVVHNVVVTSTPRGVAFAFRQIWRAAGGRVVRIVPASS